MKSACFRCEWNTNNSYLEGAAQVSAAFSLLAPDKLGSDPTIEMLVSHNQAIPSYGPNEAFIKAYQTARHNRQWVICMNDGIKYVTVETVRAGFMRGRGSIVWVVVPFKAAKEDSKVPRSYEFLVAGLRLIVFPIQGLCS